VITILLDDRQYRRVVPTRFHCTENWRSRFSEVHGPRPPEFRESRHLAPGPGLGRTERSALTCRAFCFQWLILCLRVW